MSSPDENPVPVQLCSYNELRGDPMAWEVRSMAPDPTSSMLSPSATVSGNGFTPHAPASVEWPTQGHANPHSSIMVPSPFTEGRNVDTFETPVPRTGRRRALPLTDHTKLTPLPVRNVDFEVPAALRSPWTYPARDGSQPLRNEHWAEGLEHFQLQSNGTLQLPPPKSLGRGKGEATVSITDATMHRDTALRHFEHFEPPSLNPEAPNILTEPASCNRVNGGMADHRPSEDNDHTQSNGLSADNFRSLENHNLSPIRPDILGDSNLEDSRNPKPRVLLIPEPRYHGPPLKPFDHPRCETLARERWRSDSPHYEVMGEDRWKANE